MANSVIPPGLLRFLQQQQLYIAIAVAIYAMFWAMGLQSSFVVTLAYTLLLANFTLLVQERLHFLYCDRKGLAYWMVYLALLFVAEGVGFKTAREYPLCPALARARRVAAPPADPFPAP